MSGAKGAVIDGLLLAGADFRGKNVHGVLLERLDEEKEDCIRIERTRIGGFSGDGIHFRKAWGFSVRHSMIGANLGHGISLFGWDGFIHDCWLSANRKAGFAGVRPGAGSVTMTGNRIEWNHAGGIELNGCGHYNITGNYFDRSGGPGIWLKKQRGIACERITMVGNILRRNGALAENLGDCADSHVWFEGGEGLVFSGNTMSVGQDDDQDGKWSPAYGIVLEGLRDSIIKDNALHTGALTQLVVDRGNNGEGVVIKDNVGSLAQIRGNSYEQRKNWSIHE
jgi:hypothetical protein